MKSGEGLARRHEGESQSALRVCLKGIWQFCSYLFWPQWGNKK